MPSVPASGPVPSVWRTLEAQLGFRLWAVHRLDKDASGVLVFARHAEAHRALSSAFERRETEKTYLAFTAGMPSPARGVIDTPLHPARRGRMRPARPGEAGALEAVTRYSGKAGWDLEGARVALVEAMPLTGRHHQLRVHLRSIGAPLLFDGIYGSRASTAALAGAPPGRLALHAHRLVVTHPGTGETLRLEASLPADLVALMTWLEGAGRAVAP